MIYNTLFKNANAITVRSEYFFEVAKNSTDLNVTSILVDGKEKISIGDRVPVTIQTAMETPYDTYYIANKIYSSNRSAQINEFEENDTTLFILPLVEVDIRLLFIATNFINGYISTNNNYNEIGDCVYVVYRYMPFAQYKNLMRILADHPNFISHEKAKDKRFDIIKLGIPTRYKSSTKLIFQGRYSEIPKHVKHTISKFRKRKKDDIIYQTLFNSEELRKTLAYNLEVKMSDLPKELREKPNLIKETWQN